MPAVLHAPLTNTPGFMLKERSGEPLVPAFTAVNGRTSPPSPRKLYRMNGMPSDTIHVRPLSRHSPEQPQDHQVPPPSRDEWNSVRTVSENGHPNGHHPISPSLSDQDRSPTHPGKRKRSSSVEDGRSDHSPDTSTNRRRVDSYTTMGRDDSPNTVAPDQQLGLEHQPRTLPPMERVEPDRAWAPHHDAPQNGYHVQHRDPRPVEQEPPHDGMGPSSTSPSQMSAAEGPSGFERSSTTEMTRAGVQVDPKKRKRQFANRTKTGCGTCRRRKKKCDEAKPECNNCQRGGFICEGYANKVPWPKNGVQKPHPPLQARDRFPVDTAQLYHSHGTSRESYPDPNTHNGADGARTRPIVVEEHDRQPARNGWSGSGWSEPPRTSYPPEQHPPPEYSQPPQTPNHTRPPSSEQHAPPPPAQAPPSSRQHNPRIYHHTPQTMSQVVNNSPAVTAEAALHHHTHQSHQSHPSHPSHQPPMAPPTAGPPAPPPPGHYPPPPRPPRSEKEKMLKGEPFLPFARPLVEERERCKGAVYSFNNTDNTLVEIAPGQRDRHFRAILEAKWTRNFHSDLRVSGHLGQEVYVDAPFMCDYGYNISIGNHVDIGTYCKFLDSGRITIGRNTSIGANVTIDTQRTPNDCKAVKGSHRTAVAAEVHIGENVHIGANCTILAGVSIGTGAIVHPGSVVVRDIPAHCVARGNPADYVG